MKAAIHHFLSSELGLRTEDKLLVSFSAGPDSVALLRLLLECGYHNIHLLYVNHQLREKTQIDTEIAFCKHIATQFKLTLSIRKLPVAFCASRYNLSIEAAGHHLRKYLRQHLATVKHCKAILTGHHKNDQIESCLLKLHRSANYELPLKKSHVSNTRLLVKPLLDYTKKELVSYLNSIKQAYCIDTSNDCLDYKRNDIRHRLLPALLKKDPTITDRLLRLFTSYSKGKAKALSSSPKPKSRLSDMGHYLYCELTTGFQQLSPIQKEAHVFAILNKVYDCLLPKTTLKQSLENRVDLTNEHVERIIKAISAKKEGEIGHFPKKLTAVCNKHRLYFHLPLLNNENSLSLTQSPQHFYGYSSHYEVLETVPAQLRSSDKHCYINSDAATNLQLRFIQTSDTFTPMHKKQAIGMHDYLSKQKLNKIERHFSPCICNDTAVLWVKNAAVSKQAAVSKNDKQCVKLSIDTLTRPVTHVVSY